MTLPSILVVVATLVFLALERLFPGRRLPASPGWYGRALLVNGIQLLITLATARLWTSLFGEISVFRLGDWNLPLAEGLVGWLVGSFFFYWWHRIRHTNGFWLIFHQLHHSPSRIEALTSFYKHPVEILSDSLLAAVVLYSLLGSSVMGAFWFNFFAATGEYLYHSNLRTPAVVALLHPDPRAALDPSRLRRAPLQLCGLATMGSAVRHLQGRNGVH